MPIPTDPAGRDALAKIVGRRLRASRKAAGVSQAQAAEKLRHKGITQISLAEDGQRLPTLLDMVKYADLYCVPMDFLLGRIDDPIAEAQEQGLGLVTRAVSHSIGSVFQKFSSTVAEYVSVTLSHHRQDRVDLLAAAKAAEECEKALRRIRELNPDFDDLRGGSRLESSLLTLASIGRKASNRTQEERRQVEMIDRVMDLERIETDITQLKLTFKVGTEQGV